MNRYKVYPPYKPERAEKPVNCSVCDIRMPSRGYHLVMKDFPPFGNVGYCCSEPCITTFILSNLGSDIRYK